MITALLSLFLSFAVAQPAPGSQLPAAFRDFSGGYVDTVESSNLQPNQSPNAQNVVIDDPVGSLKPRGGFDQCGVTPSGNAATNLYQYVKADGTKILIVTDNATVWETRNCETFTTITSQGLAATNQVYFTTARDKLWIVNGSTWPITWDGVTVSILDGRTNTPSSPKMPRCAYPEFWRERVWCGKTSDNLSGLYFSAQTATDGTDLDPSTGTASWPAANLFQIDQNGGSSLFGIKAYRDRLYAFKDNGIWEIQFNSEFDNSVRKTNASMGSRFHSAIKEIDGILYFVGKDGIYAFNGDESARISGQIENKFLALNQPQVNTQYKTWTSQADWNLGTQILASSSIIVGSMVASTGSLVTPSGVNADFESGATNWTYGTFAHEASCSVAGGTGNTAATATDSGLEGSKLGKLVINGCSGACSGTGTGIGTLYVNMRDGSGAYLLSDTVVTSGVNTIDLSGLTTTYVRPYFFVNNTLGGVVYEQASAYMDAGFVRGPIVQFRYSTADESGSSGNCVEGNGAYSVNHKIDIIRNITYFSSASWTSEAYNAVTVSSWTTFEATTIDNGGSIGWQIRLGKDTADISTKAYTNIIPGGVIQGSTNQIYVQVKATFNVTTTYTPEIQLAQVQWSQGGSTANKIFLYGWKNRPWISASSGTATTNNVVLVKSRLPLNSWIPYDLQIGPMAIFNDNFYVAASTHGGIYRMDYGTSDNGAAIDWSWETRDEQWGLPNNKKTLFEVDTDFKKGTAITTKVGYSLDYGASFSEKTVSMSGTGRGASRSFFNSGLSPSFRFRVRNNTLDETATITGITGWARPNRIRE